VTIATMGPPRSVHDLAVLATREAGADGYALYLRDAEDGYTRLGGGGVVISETDLALPACCSIITFPLRVPDAGLAVLAFSFRSHACTATAKSRLCRMSAAIEQVWRLSGAATGLVEMAARIGELEAQLADSKIASRVRGYLENGGDAQHDVVEAVTRHVQNVLRPFESSALFEKRRKELESELEERELAEKAKAVLQRSSGLSEGAAHLHLRMLSRKTRRPLREVALEVLTRLPA
jgi:AmiR/NasT family two-component response regulator